MQLAVWLYWLAGCATGCAARFLQVARLPRVRQASVLAVQLASQLSAQLGAQLGAQLAVQLTVPLAVQLQLAMQLAATGSQNRCLVLEKR